MNTVYELFLILILVRNFLQQGAAVAVLRGAVLYGLDPAIVHVRRATKTYGIGIIKPFNWKSHPRGQFGRYLIEPAGALI